MRSSPAGRAGPVAAPMSLYELPSQPHTANELPGQANCDWQKPVPWPRVARFRVVPKTSPLRQTCDRTRTP